MVMRVLKLGLPMLALAFWATPASAQKVLRFSKASGPTGVTIATAADSTKKPEAKAKPDSKKKTTKPATKGRQSQGAVVDEDGLEMPWNTEILVKNPDPDAYFSDVRYVH